MFEGTLPDEHKLGELRQKVRTLEERKEALKKEVADQKAEVARLRDQFDKANASFHTSEKNKVAAVERVKALEAELVGVRASLKTALADVKAAEQESEAAGTMMELYADSRRRMKDALLEHAIMSRADAARDFYGSLSYEYAVTNEKLAEKVEGHRLAVAQIEGQGVELPVELKEKIGPFKDDQCNDVPDTSASAAEVVSEEFWPIVQPADFPEQIKQPLKPMYPYWLAEVMKAGELASASLGAAGNEQWWAQFPEKSVQGLTAEDLQGIKSRPWVAEPSHPSQEDDRTEDDRVEDAAVPPQ